MTCEKRVKMEVKVRIRITEYTKGKKRSKKRVVWLPRVTGWKIQKEAKLTRKERGFLADKQA